MNRDSISCFINKEQYIADVRRTYLYLSNFDNEIKVSWFDIKENYVRSNKLIIKQKPKPSMITIEGDNAIMLYNKMEKGITDLRYDIRIGNLVIDNKEIVNNDWECTICLENHQQQDLIQLLCCKSIYHRECIHSYWKTNNKNKCPLCRNTKCPFCLDLGEGKCI